MATTQELFDSIQLQYPGAVTSLAINADRSIQSIIYAPETSDADMSSIASMIAAFDWDRPTLNLPLFEELFTIANLEGTLTDAQFAQIQKLIKVLNNIPFRNQKFAEIIEAGTPEQQAKFLQIAYQCGIPLPPDLTAAAQQIARS